MGEFGVSIGKFIKRGRSMFGEIGGGRGKKRNATYSCVCSSTFDQRTLAYRASERQQGKETHEKIERLHCGKVQNEFKYLRVGWLDELTF
jgi:hypothetical protein